MGKDWVGNKKAIFTTLGASNHTLQDRQEDDYYATDPTAIDDLFAVEEFSQYIWEPACGEGHLSKRMERLGKYVISSDLINRGYGVCDKNFLQLQNSPHITADIITNPPYKYAQEFCEKAIELTGNKVAMFLKITFLEGQKRRKLFEKYPPKTIYVYSKRKNCARGGDFKKYKDSAIAYAWYIWEKGHKGETIIKWI